MKQEVYVLAMRRLEELAKADVEHVWQTLTAKVSASRMSEVFAVIAVAAQEAIGKHGKAAVKRGQRLAADLMGREVDADAALLAHPLADALLEIQEHSRHVQALIQIRTRRMVDSGMSDESISTVLQEDFMHGGRFFAPYKNAVKRTVAGAVNGLGQAALYSAYQGGNRSGESA